MGARLTVPCPWGALSPESFSRPSPFLDGTMEESVHNGGRPDISRTDSAGTLPRNDREKSDEKAKSQAVSPLRVSPMLHLV